MSHRTCDAWHPSTEEIDILNWGKRLARARHKNDAPGIALALDRLGRAYERFEASKKRSRKR